jgi:hypothetical protein
MVYKISPNPSLPKRGKREKTFPKRGLSLPLEKGGEEGFYKS